jgi:hypothetical protein
MLILIMKEQPAEPLTALARTARALTRRRREWKTGNHILWPAMPLKGDAKVWSTSKGFIMGGIKRAWYGKE